MLNNDKLTLNLAFSQRPAVLQSVFHTVYGLQGQSAHRVATDNRGYDHATEH